MINISSKCLQALENNAVQRVEIEVKPLRGNPFTLTEKDLMANGFEWENHSVCGEQLEIGTMTVALLKLTLDNGDGRFNNIFFAGARLTVELIIPLDDGTDEHISFGVYTVDEQPRAWSTITFKAFDNMIRLDIPFNKSGLMPLISIRELVQAGIESAGLQCNDYSMFPDTLGTGGIDIRQIKSESPITWRQVLMWCCECVGVCGIADEYGYIKFGFYKKYTPDILQTESAEDLETEDNQILLIDGALEGDFELPPSARFISNTELEESDIVVTGFQFKDGDQLYPADAVMDYGLQSEGNLVFSAARAKDHFAKLANNAVAGFTYRPYSCDILSFPHLQLLDGVDYIKDGVHHHSIVTNLTFKLNGNMSIAAKAKSAVQKGWASLGALTPGQRVIIDSISQKVDKTQSDLTAREQFLISFNEAITGSMGFYSTIKERDDGSRISYMHDKPNLEESQTIYTFGVNGFAWTNDGWNDGNPVWQSGFDKNGNAILNAIYAYKLTADVIVSGHLRSQNGASWINMEDGTFCFGSDAGTALALDENKTLSVYGQLRNIRYPNYSVYIGKSETGSAGALTVTDSKVGDIFKIETITNLSTDEKSVCLSAPFLKESGVANARLEISQNDITIGIGTTAVECAKEYIDLRGHSSFIRLRENQISVSTSNYIDNHLWFNYSKYPGGKVIYSYAFGNCSEGGYGELYAAKFNTVSDLKQKENVKELSDLNALGKIMDLHFYSYDYKNTSQDKQSKEITKEDSETTVKIHENIGLIATEAPEEIQSTDGKAIDLYAYIGLIAKAVQELSEKVEQQEKEIAELKAVIQK